MSTETKTTPNVVFSKMKDDTKESRAAGLKALDKNVQLIGSTFKLPIGEHSFIVADKDAFALLTVRRKSDQKEFGLTIVAGTITYADGSTDTVEASDRIGAKTLVVPADAFLDMQCNAIYTIVVSEVNGRNVVTAVNVPKEEAVQA